MPGTALHACGQAAAGRNDSAARATVVGTLVAALAGTTGVLALRRPEVAPASEALVSTG